MGVELQQVDTVVAGHFNPHIIVPEWLVRESVFGPDAEAQIGIVVTGRAVTFKFDIGGFAWHVSQSHLVIISNTKSDTAKMAWAVVEKLPHTPVTAFGNNFRYNCDRKGWSGRLPRLGDCGTDELGEFGTLSSTTWKASFSEESKHLTTNIEVVQHEEKVAAEFNFHRQTKTLADIKVAAAAFESDRQRSEELLRLLLGAE